MKFSYSWLKQLVEVNLPAPKLAEFLSSHAFETEVSGSDQKFENILVARVTKIEKHPNADRLRVITLTDGTNTYHPVVCGAWNFEEGAIVPLALPGAVIPHDQHDPEGKPFTLSKATIRGVESQGMICSGQELGLETSSMGVMVLDRNYTVGQKFSVKSETSDTLLDIGAPANRPDLVSYRGVAWEIAALTGKKYLAKPIQTIVTGLRSKGLKVRISDTKLSKKYSAARLANIKVGPSPKFIQERLKSSGLRSINNVVDITNYVMLEVGQPLHAFDAGKVTGAITVRKAYVQESLVTLDGVKRKLNPDMLVIADSTKVLAIAGVMGGQESAVDEKTTEIILEAANFNAVSVRKTSRALGLRTDASVRFEKSIPVSFTKQGIEYASQLLEKYAQAQPIEYTSAGVTGDKKNEVVFDPENINEFLGTNIPSVDQKKILSKFGFEVTKTKARVPFWRPDILAWQDLAEEIARYKGLEHIKLGKPVYPMSSSISDKNLETRDMLLPLLQGMGFDEAYTYSFVSESFIEKNKIDKKSLVEIIHPLSADQKYLRSGIGMNYEKIVEQNSRFVGEQSMFEIGNVFKNVGGKVEESTNLFMISFSKSAQPVSKLVGSVNELFKRLGIVGEVKQTHEAEGEIYADNVHVGHIVAANDDVKWAAVEISFEKLVEHISQKQFQSIARFPAKELDVAILVGEHLPWGEIKKSIKHPLVIDVRLFDVYMGKNISPGKKSLAFRIIYQSPSKTLTDDEVNKIHSNILVNLKSKFGATVRD